MSAEQLSSPAVGDELPGRKENGPAIPCRWGCWCDYRASSWVTATVFPPTPASRPVQRIRFCVLFHFFRAREVAVPIPQQYSGGIAQRSRFEGGCRCVAGWP